MKLILMLKNIRIKIEDWIFYKKLELMGKYLFPRFVRSLGKAVKNMDKK